MSDNYYLTRLALKNVNVSKKLQQLVQAGGGFEVLSATDTRLPDLLILELGADHQKDINRVQALLEAGEVGEVFLTSQVADPAILMQAIRIGAKEFISQPVNTEDVQQALGRFKERRKAIVPHTPAKHGQIITVFGSKGGVGTTTVAVNLAVSLSQKKSVQSVALLDMNTLFGEIPLFLEISPKFHWGEITKNIERLDDTFLKNILTRHSTGVEILASPAYLNGHLKPTPQIMTRLLGLMKKMFDYVIIDGGQSTDETSLKVLEISNRLLLITILSLPCLANANKLVKSFTDLGYVPKDRIHIVLNRYMKKSEVSLGDAEQGIGLEIFWIIPNDFRATMSAINKGQSLIQLEPKAPITKNFLNFANLLDPAKERQNKKGWRLFSR
jgi:pilus assembly protein CpaE